MFLHLQACYNAAVSDKPPEKLTDSEVGISKPETLSGATKSLAESLLLVLGFLYNEKHTSDYYIVLSKEYILSSQVEVHFLILISCVCFVDTSGIAKFKC